MAQIFAAAGLYQEAAETYEEAIAKQPRDSCCLYRRGGRLMELLEYEKAENVYRAVLRTFGGHPSPLTARWRSCILPGTKRPKAEDMALARAAR